MTTTVNRVAINTAVNYIQIILNVLFGLLTVRYVFQSLGEIDYGIYNLIAGVITLITFISESLSQTSIRFISISLGSGNNTMLRQVFSSCFSLHLYMAIILAIILELAGLFLFSGFLDIPDSRLFAAKIVYQCMVLALLLNIISTPFRAIIVAHESLVYISAIGILESLCKLLVAIALLYTSSDRLIVYGVLMAAISLVPFIGFYLFSIIRYKRVVSLKLVGYLSIKQIVNFAGWTLLDVLGVIANRQGYAIMYNKFLGPSTNAVFALAGHVEGPLFSVSASVINSVKPQILKSYGQGDKERTLRLSLTAGKLGFSLMAMIAIPVLIMLPDVLRIWLGDYPDQTVFFSRMMIIACMTNQITLGLSTGNQAFGKIKVYSIVVSSIRMMALPISIFLLLLGCTGEIAMIVYLCCESLASLSRVIVMYHTAGLSIKAFFTDVIIDLAFPVALAIFVCTILYSFGREWPWLVLAAIISAIVYASSLYIWGMTKEERFSVDSLVSTLSNKCLKRNKE